jgi:hypothetical protein
MRRSPRGLAACIARPLESERHAQAQIAWTQPPAAAIGQKDIEDHHPLDHSADDAETPVSIVGLADRLVERLVVDVLQPPSSRRSRLDDPDESADCETGHEIAAVWPRTVLVNAQYCRSRKQPE